MVRTWRSLRFASCVCLALRVSAASSVPETRRRKVDSLPEAPNRRPGKGLKTHEGFIKSAQPSDLTTTLHRKSGKDEDLTARGRSKTGPALLGRSRRSGPDRDRRDRRDKVEDVPWNGLHLKPWGQGPEQTKQPDDGVGIPLTTKRNHK